METAPRSELLPRLREACLREACLVSCLLWAAAALAGRLPCSLSRIAAVAVVVAAAVIARKEAAPLGLGKAAAG